MIAPWSSRYLRLPSTIPAAPECRNMGFLSNVAVVRWYIWPGRDRRPVLRLFAPFRGIWTFAMLMGSFCRGGTPLSQALIACSVFFSFTGPFLVAARRRSHRYSADSLSPLWERHPAATDLCHHIQNHSAGLPLVCWSHNDSVLSISYSSIEALIKCQ